MDEKQVQGVAAQVPRGCDPTGSAVPASCKHRIPNANLVLVFKRGAQIAGLGILASLLDWIIPGYGIHHIAALSLIAGFFIMADASERYHHQSENKDGMATD